MRRLAISFVSIFVLLASWVQDVQGQVPYFQHYSLLKKNEFVQVNAIFQDKAGFIWYGTNKGLFKFDGISLHRFTVADGLPDEQVTAIAEDSLGALWIGHKNGHLAFLQDGHITQFHTPEGDATQEVSDILFDRKGNLWFSTLNDGLYYFLASGRRLYRLDESEGMPDLFVYDIVEDASGKIWAGTDGGIAVCSLKNSKVKIDVQNYKTGLPDNIIKKIVLDHDGSIWLATEDAGIIHYDPVNRKYTPLIEGGWRYGVITDFILHEGKIWISTSSSGLLVFNRATSRVKTYDGKLNISFSSIQVLIDDIEGNIWAGSKEDILRTKGDHVEFIDTFESITDINTVAIAIDKQSAQWFATSEGLFKRSIDGEGKVVIAKPLVKSIYEKYSIISLYADSLGYIWAGLYGEGVLRINPATNAIRYLNKELRNGNVLNITGNGKVVWLATLGGGTRIRVDGDKFDIKNFTSEDGLISDYVYQVFIDSHENIWFATDGKGVDMLDEKGFHHYQEGLNSKVVYGFAEDGNHVIWINVQGDGLYSLVNGRFEPFSKTGKHLRDNNIGVLSSTASGNLFVMHDLGIDIYDVHKNIIYSLGEDVGLREKRPNLNAFSKSNRGNIYVGTDRGLVRYSDFAETVQPTPSPFIEDVQVMNKPVEFDKGLQLDYNQNDVTIHYLGIWYQNPVMLNYLYRLENYEKEWISSRDHSVTYSNLPAGEYNFLIKASDTEDFSEAQTTSVKIVISPPFWRTAWFYAFSVMAALLLIYGVIKYRERRLRRDKQILEASVRERTLEIIKKNEEIHAQAEEIRAINENLEELVKERTSELVKKNKALEEYAFINAHELRAPVASILGLVNLMETIPIDQEESKVYLKHLQDSAYKLDDVVRSIGKAIERGEA